MLETESRQRWAQGNRAGNDWVASIATQAELGQLSETPLGSHIGRDASPGGGPGWQDESRWPTLYPLLKSPGLQTTGIDPWLAGFMDGAVEATRSRR
jgi:hypothetical protein